MLQDFKKLNPEQEYDLVFQSTKEIAQNKVDILETKLEVFVMLKLFFEDKF